ncbi:MAG: TIGR04283 family arsenosugar biosynthesis glycosyltransferase [Elainellaceae cyanobacterium]
MNTQKDSPLDLQPLNSVTTLIIFTRYPIPGQTKTRLIPALGEEGAATLQRQMTEHTLKTAQALVQAATDVRVEIRFSGGSLGDMQQWLGQQWHYTPQGEGDLGDRLIRAFQTAFEQGAQRAIAIGIDCPGITASLLHSATHQLHDRDLVLGPAADGGYYLIGLSRFMPNLFRSIDWGTDQVLRQTLACASRLHLTSTKLHVLADVDRPDDLQVWEKISAQQDVQSASAVQPLPSKPSSLSLSTASPSTAAHDAKLNHSEPKAAQSTFLSVIVPVLNEVEQIDTQLHHLRETQAVIPESTARIEIIVVDGGSHDATLNKLHHCNFTVLQAPPGKASQMNCGAEAAKGEVLLFLHADTQLPSDFLQQMCDILAQPATVAGAFSLRINGSKWGLRLVEWGIRWRSTLLSLPYGDQGLFLKKQTFEQVGGFPDLPIMEDYAIVQKLKKLGRVAIAPSFVTTSSRRWQRLGILRTTLLNQMIVLAYHLKISPQQLNHWYRGKS